MQQSKEIDTNTELDYRNNTLEQDCSRTEIEFGTLRYDLVTENLCHTVCASTTFAVYKQSQQKDICVLMTVQSQEV